MSVTGGSEALIQGPPGSHKLLNSVSRAAASMRGNRSSPAEVTIVRNGIMGTKRTDFF